MKTNISSLKRELTCIGIFSLLFILNSVTAQTWTILAKLGYPYSEGTDIVQYSYPGVFITFKKQRR